MKFVFLIFALIALASAQALNFQHLRTLLQTQQQQSQNQSQQLQNTSSNQQGFQLLHFINPLSLGIKDEEIKSIPIGTVLQLDQPFNVNIKYDGKNVTALYDQMSQQHLHIQKFLTINELFKFLVGSNLGPAIIPNNVIYDQMLPGNQSANQNQQLASQQNATVAQNQTAALQNQTSSQNQTGALEEQFECYQVNVPSGAKVMYWAPKSGSSSTQGLQDATVANVYGNFENSGVVTADNSGIAKVQIMPSSSSGSTQAVRSQNSTAANNQTSSSSQGDQDGGGSIQQLTQSGGIPAHFSYRYNKAEFQGQNYEFMWSEVFTVVAEKSQKC
jgi:hypothetical protein